MKEMELYDDNLEKEISSLKCLTLKGEGIIIERSDYGLAEIYRLHDTILVYEIPEFGGLPSFGERFNLKSGELVVKYLKSLT